MTSMKNNLRLSSRQIPLAILMTLGALAVSGCANLFPPAPAEAPVVTEETRLQKILETHAGKVSSAWVRLADVRESLKKTAAVEERQKAAEFLAILDRPARPMVFSGDIEDFLTFVAMDMYGWTVVPAEGSKMSVSHVVNIRSAEGETYRDILMDASHQLSGVLEIVVNPSAKSLRVRYPTLR